MPLEVCFVPDGHTADEEVENKLIEPGDGLVMENYATGEREILVIECPKEDNGGTVSVLPSEAIPDLNILEGRVPKSVLSPAVALIKVDMGGTEDLEFRNFEGDGATFRVKCVAAYAITASGLIPRSLRHFN